MSKHSEKAVDLFRQGYNCGQSVFAAFSDVTGMDTTTALRLTSPLGGGMGHLREVCGAVSGMFLVAGMLYGFEDPKDGSAKAEHYKIIQELAKGFRDKNGSLLCRELLGLEPGMTSPEPLTDAQKRGAPHSCEDLIRCAAERMDTYLEEHGKKIPACV